MHRIISNVLIIGLAVPSLVHFVMIAVWGRVIIKEPILEVLIAEITALVGILAFGVWRLVKEYQAILTRRKQTRR